jgi:hypothetical protein
VVGLRTSINVAIDWTEFDADGQATLMLSLLTRHGRATPAKALMKLLWQALGHRMWVSRHQGPALRHGDGIDPCQHAGRRDRLWLLNAFAIMLLTLLGAAGEALGYDRYLKSNTTKRRTHSLFRQGCMLYDLIPNMPEARLLPPR